MIRDLIASLRGKMSVIISSHILPEIEMTCDQVMIINSGKIVGQGTPKELREAFITSTIYELEINGNLTNLRDSLKTVATDLEVTQFEEADERGFSKVSIRIPGDHDYGELIFSCLAGNSQTPSPTRRRVSGSYAKELGNLGYRSRQKSTVV